MPGLPPTNLILISTFPIPPVPRHRRPMSRRAFPTSILISVPFRTRKNRTPVPISTLTSAPFRTRKNRRTAFRASPSILISAALTAKTPRIRRMPVPTRRRPKEPMPTLTSISAASAAKEWAIRSLLPAIFQTILRRAAIPPRLCRVLRWKRTGTGVSIPISSSPLKRPAAGRKLSRAPRPARCRKTRPIPAEREPKTPSTSLGERTMIF